MNTKCKGWIKANYSKVELIFKADGSCGARVQGQFGIRYSPSFLTVKEVQSEIAQYERLKAMRIELKAKGYKYTKEQSIYF